MLQQLEPSLQELKGQIQGRFKETGAYATGRSAESLEVKDEETAIRLLGGNWLTFTETGRAPGKVPYGIKYLQAWGHARGITDPRALMAISWSIHFKGTQIYRQKKLRDIYTTLVDKYCSDLDNKLDGVVQVIAEDFIGDINKIIDEK